MNYESVYSDIAQRTNGDIYIGVVGPVRTGKSTFISKMLNSLVLPNIIDSNVKERAIDEMPQSGDGKTIMTTQPKFIPNEAVNINLDNDVSFNVRLIDCVGYLVDGAMGHVENDKPRLVVTPWSKEEMPFEKAAEIGTNKVITNHSTVGVLVTTDGSITDIPRENYLVAEERVVRELKAYNKPFVIVLNSTHPESPETKNLRKSMQEKYGTRVLALNVEEMNIENINEIFASILNEFPLVSASVKMPTWMRALPYNNSIILELTNAIMNIIKDFNKIGDIPEELTFLEESEDFEPIVNKTIELGKGKVIFEVNPKPHLFYKVLSEQCDCEIKNDYHLVSYIKQLSVAKKQYDKFKSALEQVKETGYGVVSPSLDELELEEPKMMKQGGKFGVKLKASAPSLHIMQVDIETEVNSLVGTEQQSEDLVKYMMSEFENNPQGIWDTKMFGTSLNTLVNENLHNKLMAVPTDTIKKMRKTMGRIVNEGKGGIICILL